MGAWAERGCRVSGSPTSAWPTASLHPSSWTKAFVLQGEKSPSQRAMHPRRDPFSHSPARAGSGAPVLFTAMGPSLDEPPAPIARGRLRAEMPSRPVGSPGLSSCSGPDSRE